MSQQDKEVEEKKDEAISRQDGQEIGLLDSARSFVLVNQDASLINREIREVNPTLNPLPVENRQGLPRLIPVLLPLQGGQEIGLLDSASPYYGFVYQYPSLIYRERREVNPNRNPQPVENRQGLPRLIPVRPIPLPLLVPIALPSIEDVDRNVGGA